MVDNEIFEQRRSYVNSETSRIAKGKGLNKKQMSKLWKALWSQSRKRYPDE